MEKQSTLIQVARKDRAALALIRDAEKLISKGGTIVEGTAGNTGIGLCLLGNSLVIKLLS